VMPLHAVRADFRLRGRGSLPSLSRQQMYLQGLEAVGRFCKPFHHIERCSVQGWSDSDFLLWPMILPRRKSAGWIDGVGGACAIPECVEMNLLSV